MITGNHHFNRIRIIRRQGQETEALKKASYDVRAAKTHFTCSVALSLEEQQTQNKITQVSVAAVFQNTDITQQKSTVFPPDPAGGYGNGILKYKSIPAHAVEVIRTAAENCLSNRDHIGKIGTGSKPFSLNHRYSFLKYEG